MILNRTIYHRDRYRIVEDSMGCCGEPPNHASHFYGIVAGIDRGNGYQCYMAISYFLTVKWVPEEAKRNCRKFLKARGFDLDTLCQQ